MYILDIMGLHGLGLYTYILNNAGLMSWGDGHVGKCRRTRGCIWVIDNLENMGMVLTVVY